MKAQPAQEQNMPNRDLKEQRRVYGSPMSTETPGASRAARPRVGDVDQATRQRLANEQRKESQSPPMKAAAPAPGKSAPAADVVRGVDKLLSPKKNIEDRLAEMGE